MSSSLSSSAQLRALYDKCYAELERAQACFIRFKNVVAVGVGPREFDKRINPCQPCLIIYVKSKKAVTELQDAEVLPREFRGVQIDVVEADKRRWPEGDSYSNPWLTSVVPMAGRGFHRAYYIK